MALASVTRVAAQTTVWWDTNGNTAGSSGGNTAAGTWAQNSGSMWTTNSDGTAATGTWQNRAGTSGIATFAAGNNATGPYTVSVSGTVTGVRGLVFDEGSVTLGGTGTLTLSGTTTIDTKGNTAVISARLGGTGWEPVTKIGTGTLVLQGTNTFTGPITVSAGALRLENPSALGQSGWGNTVANGAELQLAGGVAVAPSNFTIQGTGVSGSGALRNISGANTLGGPITIGSSTTIGLDAGSLELTGDLSLGSTITSIGSGNLRLSGAIYGSGGLTLNGSGTVTIAGASANSNAGAVTINDGTLVVAKTSGIAFQAPVTINNDGTLRLGAANQLDDGKAITITNSAARFDLNGFDEAIGSLTMTGGSVTTGAGRLTLSTSGTGAITTLAANTTATISGNLQIGTYNTPITVADGAAATDLDISATISGAQNILKSGTGTLAVSGASTYTGTTTISQGTVKVLANALAAQDGPLGNASSAVTLNNGSTGASQTALTIATSGVTIGRAIQVANNGTGTTLLGGDGTLTSGTATFAGGVALGRSTVFQSAGSAQVTFSGVLSGAGGMTKTGSGTVALTGANTFSGGVLVNEGTLSAYGTSAIGGFGALGRFTGLTAPATVVTVAEGATLAVSSNVTTGTGSSDASLTFPTLSLRGTGVDGAGALTNTAGSSSWLGNVALAGATTIANTAAAGDANLLFFGPYVEHAAQTFTLNNHALTFGGTGDIAVMGRIGASAGDTGNVTLNGTGTVYYMGERNYYTGATNVNSGTLFLADLSQTPTTVKNVAILGNLNIGDGSGAAGSALVQQYYSDQISDTATVTIHSDGKLDLATHSQVEGIGPLVLRGGQIDTGTGKLVALNTISVNNRAADNAPAVSTIDGRLEFGAANTVDVAGANSLRVDAWIVNGSFVKTGTGTMTLTHDNFNGGNGYLGTTTVSGGILNIQNSGALGASRSNDASAGTIVNAGATLQLQAGAGGNVLVGSEEPSASGREALTLSGSGYDPGTGALGALNSASGDNSWRGGIKLDSSATIRTETGSLRLYNGISNAQAGNATVTFAGSGNTSVDGPISNGAGMVAVAKEGSGTLTLSGANDFTGPISINAGTLSIPVNSGLLANANTVNVAAGATFSLSGGADYTNRIAGLTGAGQVQIANQTRLAVNTPTGAENIFDGRLVAPGGSSTINTALFLKTGAGTLTFSSVANTSAFNFQGTVLADAGTLKFGGGSEGNALTIGTLELGGGTLLLSGAYINVGTLRITGDTILDFGNGGASILRAQRIVIDADATLTLQNWTSEVDFLYAMALFQQAGGPVAGYNQIGQDPEHQIHFPNNVVTDGSNTAWINYDLNGFKNFEIRPIPEPSTYGAFFIGGSLLLLGASRFRTARRRR